MGPPLLPVEMSAIDSGPERRRSPKGLEVGRFLMCGEWNRAHQIAQDLPTAEGSFWHAIVHRREPDPGNAVYWYRKAGGHPVYPTIQSAVLALPPYSGFSPEAWDPSAWVDFWVRAHRQDGAALAHAMEIDRIEIQSLFAYCAERVS